MQPIGLDELKKIQTEILDEVVAFCEAHGIRYYLAYGTLLGAVRHKGYIPEDKRVSSHDSQAYYL